MVMKKRYFVVASCAMMTFLMLPGIAYSDPYPLDTCIVLGGKLGAMGDPVVIDHNGREVRFCCAGCKPKFLADPDPYLKKLDAAIVEQQKDLYPLDTCVVMGNKLSKDKTVEYVYNNRLVRFCCAGCIDKLEKDPKPYLAKIDAAVIEKQKAAYPLDTCVVMGKKLDENAVDYVSGNRLVRLCCPDCIKAFDKDPAKYSKLLDEAKAAKK